MNLSIRKSVLLAIICCSALLLSCQSSNPKEEIGGNENSANLDNVSDSSFVTFSELLNKSQPLVSAHRGGPYPGYPENAIETFQNIIDHTPAIIECDVSMTKDSVLILMHDKTIDRTSKGTGKVSEMNYDELKDLALIDNEGVNTTFKIPKLDEVLVWGKGKALFTLDIKRGVPFEKVINAIRRFDAESYAAVITYRIDDAKTVNLLHPELMISVSAKDDAALEQIVKSNIPSANLLGFVGTREPSQDHYQKLREMGIKTILGTLGNLDRSAVAKGNDNVYLTYIKNGANIIATDRPLEVASVIKLKK